jgi:hypothetical protein
MHAPTRFQEGDVRDAGYSLYAVLAALALAALTSQAVAQATPTETPTLTPTSTPTCAPTGTPYCSDNCVPCPTVRPECYVSACGWCIQNPTCTSNEACVSSYSPYINGGPGRQRHRALAVADGIHPPPLSGGLDVGVLNVTLPVSSGFGSGGLYSVDVVDVSATSAGGSPLPLQGLGATITRCSMIFFGLVTDAATGDAIDGASVCLHSGACTQSDANGVYRDLCYPGQSSAGTYLCATADGYQQACQGPWTPTGSSFEVDFPLTAPTIPPPTPTDTPTATPTTAIVDHPTPTETAAPTPTATLGPTDTPCPTGAATTPTPTATAIVASPCVGDCNSDDTVTVDEILTLVNIALGNLELSTCEDGDGNGHGQITVDEILTAVNNALNGC